MAGAAKDATCAASPEVDVCDICGVVGFIDCLAVCTQCSERAEHVYCIQPLCDAVSPNWVCEGCKKRNPGDTCDVEIGRKSCPLLSKINHKTQSIKTLSPLQETSSHNEQCTFRQGREEVQEATPLKSVLNHGLSKSKSSDSDQLPSFLLPSRPKSLLRSNSANIRSSSLGANKKANQLSDAVEVSEDEHSRMGHAPVGNENSCQQGVSSIPRRNFTYKSQGVMAVEAGSNCGNISESQHVAIDRGRGSQSKFDAENQKDMSCIEAHKVKHDDAREKEAKVPETTSHGKAALSCSKKLAPEMRKPIQMVHAGILPQPIFLSGAPVYPIPRFPVPHGGFYPLLVGSRRWQPRHFHPPQGRPHGPQMLMQHTISQSTNGACVSNVSNVNYLPPHLEAVPEVRKLWRGHFSVLSSSNCSTLYNGIQAHPSSKADPKVWEAAQTLPRLLKLKELKRGLDNSTWPQRFLDTPPTTDNIGMFFFPVDMESHDSWYKPLVDRLIAYDLILRAESASLYLLIFHSQLLPEADQLWDGRRYLWGVFRTKTSSSIKRTSSLQSAVNANCPTSLNDNGEVLDMEIDMVAGADIHPSTTRYSGLPLPPLPPSSPPTNPPPPPMPPHQPYQDADVSLLGRGLPSAPPSPPPTPPQSQQEIVLESSLQFSCVPKLKSVVQEGSCSTSNILEGLSGGGKKQPCPVPDSADKSTPILKKARLEGMKNDNETIPISK